MATVNGKICWKEHSTEVEDLVLTLADFVILGNALCSRSHIFPYVIKRPENDHPTLT